MKFALAAAANKFLLPFAMRQFWTMEINEVRIRYAKCQRLVIHTRSAVRIH